MKDSYTVMVATTDTVAINNNFFRGVITTAPTTFALTLKEFASKEVGVSTDIVLEM